MFTRSTENLLYRAFNPITELSSSGTLGNLTGAVSDSDLTAAERIADDSRIRFLLERELTFGEFKILQMYFTSTRDIDSARHVFHTIRPAVIKATRISSTVDKDFVDFVALSEFWDYNLLRKDRCGVLADFGNQFSNCRRKKRIVGVLQGRKKIALKKAIKVLNDYHMPDDADNAAARA